MSRAKEAIVKLSARPEVSAMLCGIVERFSESVALKHLKLVRYPTVAQSARAIKSAGPLLGCELTIVEVTRFKGIKDRRDLNDSAGDLIVLAVSHRYQDIPGLSAELTTSLWDEFGNDLQSIFGKRISDAAGKLSEADWNHEECFGARTLSEKLWHSLWTTFLLAIRFAANREPSLALCAGGLVEVILDGVLVHSQSRQSARSLLAFAP